MVEIMSKLSQPLVINMNDGTSLHLLAKEKVSITMEQFKSIEVQTHITNNNLIVLKIN